MIGFILNLPYSLIGVALALISRPRKLAFEKSALAFIFYVRSLWWRNWGYAKGVRALTVGCTVLLSPQVEEKDLEHELILVNQHKRFPIIFPLLYYIELLRKGYRSNKYEDEAYRLSGNRYAAE